MDHLSSGLIEMTRLPPLPTLRVHRTSVNLTGGCFTIDLVPGSRVADRQPTTSWYGKEHLQSRTSSMPDEPPIIKRVSFVLFSVEDTFIPTFQPLLVSAKRLCSHKLSVCC
ncbi:unnamed protein product [Protopolystoma xenopodis]|uniref:Uncharacterized protein n=1 Tax=Protopolystoma xenopodis TaxID=117903 RepID=A0A448X482_9PLAT|nr:unnamed protein product [Protopolystoma xenopodis]